mmetsp:Transcript_6870/g.10776  ORF Transcript_6870/g.10776 Transcript_6870/m.10776 type:complete len:237 (-) Transcript_6870:361-1071(-)|eukprot:CAMPEP_0184657496 /NCGR_PEP_ID=MMETSP0308-20130426/20173_1 /TAXON_ID=38269 /ORGANISM="Gloeochaete witrockiana, Strain SAG 46.84" /LENGTH=236 /DNA_ID=CAMNT_0027095427 /DNA_START=121 /DNA_END=831 /DNA_ORIENTATION=+
MAGQVAYKLGLMIRETGQALDRLGSRLQGNYAFREKLSRHRTLMNLYDKKPRVGSESFVAPSASLIGDVSIGKNSSVWYGAVLRGDVNSIRIGNETNVQDRAVVHVSNILEGKPLPTTIGNKVTIGHGAIINGATIEDETIIGMGSTVLDGAIIGKHSIVAAGAVVPAGQTVPSGQVWAGNPAKFVRNVTDHEKGFFQTSAEEYAKLASEHVSEWGKAFEFLEAEKKSRKALAADS